MSTFWSDLQGKKVVISAPARMRDYQCCHASLPVTAVIEGEHGGVLYPQPDDFSVRH